MFASFVAGVLVGWCAVYALSRWAPDLLHGWLYPKSGGGPGEEKSGGGPGEEGPKK